jgi:hypothetical protein
MLEHVKLGEKDFPLDGQVATLTERRQVPPRAVRFIVVQVMDRQGISGCRVMGVPAALAPVAGLGADAGGEERPVGRIFTGEFHFSFPAAARKIA